MNAENIHKQDKLFAVAITLALHITLILFFIWKVIAISIPEKNEMKELIVTALGSNDVNSGSIEENNVEHKSHSSSALNASNTSTAPENSKEKFIAGEDLDNVLSTYEKNKNKNYGTHNSVVAPGGETDEGKFNEKDPIIPIEGPYILPGRKMIGRPVIVDDSQGEGKVIVAIVVDENGKVISADPGQRGSATTSSILLEKARRAALSARFNPSAGIKEQRGTMIFNFVLN